jgi:hypothetical protein
MPDHPVSVPRFRPTGEAVSVLAEILKRWVYMDGFVGGPFDKNRLTDTEAALWASCYEIRSLISDVGSMGDASQRLAAVWNLLTDGVLRSLVLARGGEDWVESEVL